MMSLPTGDIRTYSRLDQNYDVRSVTSDNDDHVLDELKKKPLNQYKRRIRQL